MLQGCYMALHMQEDTKKAHRQFPSNNCIYLPEETFDKKALQVKMQEEYNKIWIKRKTFSRNLNLNPEDLAQGHKEAKFFLCFF